MNAAYDRAYNRMWEKLSGSYWFQRLTPAYQDEAVRDFLADIAPPKRLKFQVVVVADGNFTATASRQHIYR